MFEMIEVNDGKANIKVVGVGGAGGNAVNNMIGAEMRNVDFMVVNTDAQVLATSLAPRKLQIGSNVTRGLGAGANPQVGREAAIEDSDKIRELLEGADMVFITAGMGGGTGTGAAPVIAEIARNMGALTVAVVTKPFFYEGKKRLNNAMIGIKELNQYVDTIIVIPNDKIQLVVEKGTPLLKSFAVANDVLRDAVSGITEVILGSGLINLDFADVKTVMQYSGKAVMGVGRGKGEQGHIEAARKAISNPLLEETSLDGARGILINITGGIEMTLDAVQGAAELVYDTAHDDADIFLGAVIDGDLKDEVKVTVIATGFEEKKDKIKTSESGKWKPEREHIEAGVGSDRGNGSASNGRARAYALKSPERDTAHGAKGSERVLSKSLFEYSKDEKLPATELVSYDDEMDIPTFIRKQQEER
jgi:cell division protein FtsZ